MSKIYKPTGHVEAMQVPPMPNGTLWSTVTADFEKLMTWLNENHFPAFVVDGDLSKGITFGEEDTRARPGNWLVLDENGIRVIPSWRFEKFFTEVSTLDEYKYMGVSA